MAGDTRGPAGRDRADGSGSGTAPSRLGRAVILGGWFLTLVLLLVSVVDLVSDYRTVIKESEQNARNLARVLAAQTQAAIGTIDQALLHVVQVVGAESSGQVPGDPRVHRLLLGMTEQVPFLREVDIFDAQGNSVQMSRTQPVTPLTSPTGSISSFIAIIPRPACSSARRSGAR